MNPGSFRYNRTGAEEEEYRTAGPHGGQGETVCFGDVHYDVRPRVLIGVSLPPVQLPPRCLQLFRVVPFQPVKSEKSHGVSVRNGLSRF
jgi:hypothetical protein